MFDIDGNRICKKCMETGGKKKSRRTRAIEAMKQEIEGKTTWVDRRGSPKVPGVKPKRPITQEKKGGHGVLWGVLFLLVLLAGGAAAAVHFGVIQIPEGFDFGGGKTPDAGGGDKGGPAPESKTVIPKEERSYEPRTFQGTYVGVNLNDPDERLSGSLIFESKKGETVYIVLPEAARDTAKVYVKGKTYRFTFEPDDQFYEIKRLTLSMLDGHIEPID
jgi:hypothetical protein